MTTFYEHDKTRGGRKTTRYTAVGQQQDNGLYNGAHVDLYHETERPNFGAPHEDMGDPSPYADIGNKHRLMDSGGTPSTQLFRNQPGEITGAFADSTMRAHMPTLLGLAADRNMRATGGRMPMPARSLSAQSAPMVQKLRAKGIDFPVNPDNPDAKVNNGITPGDIQVSEYDESIQGGRVMKPGEVNSGRSLVRSMMLRRSVNPNQFKEDEQLGVSTVMNPSPENAQQNFPGMEPKKR